MGIERRLLIIIIVVSTLVACTPIGYTHDEDGEERSLWAVPRRQVYNVGHYFDLDKDIWAFFSYSTGTMEPVNVTRLQIDILPNNNGNMPIPIQYPRTMLTSTVGKGNKTVRITCEGKTAEYSIEVNDPYGLVAPEDEEGINVGGVGIIWK